MRFRIVSFITLLCAAYVTAGGVLADAPAATTQDGRLERARRYVEQSERYLHHSKLRRGMKGYGLSVFEGTKIAKFDVEIISVMTKWGPHQDAILARLSGQGLEKSGVVQGMSGSPVYVEHEGKDKLIGAVAFAFFAQKQAICGIQPITQMLVLRDAVPDSAAPETAGGGTTGTEHLHRLLQADTKGVLELIRPDRAAHASLTGSAAPRLTALKTPIMTSGVAPRCIRRAGELLEPLGFVPVQAGAVGGIDAREIESVKLEAGAVLSIPLVTGDADFCAIGTVTEIINGCVLGFGHSFFGEGDIAFPMGPGYVHTVVPGILESFKLSSTARITGVLTRDEYVGVAGRVGVAAPMIPMTVTIDWTSKGRKETLNYKICRHRVLTPLLAALLIESSAWGWSEPPELHTVRHSVELDLGELGRYSTSDISSGMDVWNAVGDCIRVVSAMLDNPLGKPAHIESINVSVAIEQGDKSGAILKLKLDGNVYRPGDSLTGVVVVKPFRAPRATLRVRFELPSDLPEGRYTLTACDGLRALQQFRREKPQRFDPRTVPQLLESLRNVVAPVGDRLYLRLPVPRRGVAIRGRELIDLPESKGRILVEAEPLDTHQFSETLVREVQTPYVLMGSASAAFEVKIHPQETFMRNGRNDTK